MMRVYSDIEGHEKSRSDPITYLLNHLQYVFKKRKPRQNTLPPRQNKFAPR